MRTGAGGDLRRRSIILQVVTRLLFHAIALAIIAGALFTLGAILGGPVLFRALGGRDGALDAAIDIVVSLADEVAPAVAHLNTPLAAPPR